MSLFQVTVVTEKDNNLATIITYFTVYDIASALGTAIEYSIRTTIYSYVKLPKFSKQISKLSHFQSR